MARSFKRRNRKSARKRRSSKKQRGGRLTDPRSYTSGLNTQFEKYAELKRDADGLIKNDGTYKGYDMSVDYTPKMLVGDPGINARRMYDDGFMSTKNILDEMMKVQDNNAYRASITSKIVLAENERNEAARAFQLAKNNANKRQNEIKKRELTNYIERDEDKSIMDRDIAAAQGYAGWANDTPPQVGGDAGVSYFQADTKAMQDATDDAINAGLNLAAKQGALTALKDSREMREMKAGVDVQNYQKHNQQFYETMNTMDHVLGMYATPGARTGQYTDLDYQQVIDDTSDIAEQSDALQPIIDRRFPSPSRAVALSRTVST